MGAVLSVAGLRVEYAAGARVVRAVDDVTFDLAAGERLAIVGESGSGKSTLAMALMRLIRPPGRIAQGSIRLDGTELLALDDEAMRRLRLAKIALVPQGAMNSLNPVMRVADQIRDGLEDHALGRSAGGPDRVADVLDLVGLDRAAGRLYPHELSGGMKQRVAIAIAISTRPKVIVADEPTSALDVVVQRQIIEMLMALQDALAAAVILIGHDIGLVAQFADRIGVMYAGRLIELGSVRAILREPRHPYTQMLIGSVPTLARRVERLTAIPGAQPALDDLPGGCAFGPRCPRRVGRCDTDRPELASVAPAHAAACHLAGVLS